MPFNLKRKFITERIALDELKKQQIIKSYEIYWKSETSLEIIIDFITFENTNHSIEMIIDTEKGFPFDPPKCRFKGDVPKNISRDFTSDEYGNFSMKEQNYRLTNICSYYIQSIIYSPKSLDKEFEDLDRKVSNIRRTLQEKTD